MRACSNLNRIAADCSTNSMPEFIEPVASLALHRVHSAHKLTLTRTLSTLTKTLEGYSRLSLNLEFEPLKIPVNTPVRSAKVG